MPAIEINDKVVLITGANRGIGKAFALTALEMGVKKVYACARDTSTLGEVQDAGGDRVVPLQVDVTNQEQITAAAAAAGDVEVLINNAGMGSALGGPLTATDGEEGMRAELDANYFGIIKMVRAFSDALGSNGGGAVVNILSISALTNFPFAPGYSASKHAAHSMTQHIRAELSKQNTLVTGVYPGPIDTDMAKALPFNKAAPESVAVNVFKAIANGEEDVFPDPFAVEFAKQLKSDRKALEKANAAALG